MTLAEQIAQLKQLLAMSADARFIDLVLVNLIEELYEALAAMRGGDEPRGFGSI